MDNAKIHETVWTPDKIRGRLIDKHGRKYAEALAAKSGMSRAWVSRHISGTLTTPEGQALIASEVDASVAEIWGDTHQASVEEAA